MAGAADQAEPRAPWSCGPRGRRRAEALIEAIRTAARGEALLSPTGMSNAEIAEHLTLSPLTVKTHVNHAMTKLDARDRAQVVVIAYEAGLRGPQ